MAVRPYIGTIKHLKPTPLEDQVFVASKSTSLNLQGLKPTGGNCDEAPHASLNLQYVHGYAGQKSRNNLFYLKHTRFDEDLSCGTTVEEILSSGENYPKYETIVYHVAGVGIVRSTDPRNSKQRFAFHHTDDILCKNIFFTFFFTCFTFFPLF